MPLSTPCRRLRLGAWPVARRAWLLAVCVWLFCLRAEARELRWRELAVTARLDAEGKLHVSELHRMVFTGAWNGGERRFRVVGDQRLHFEGISRVEGDGREVPLVEAGLSGIDEFAWFEAYALRWRSRLPDDLPFDQTELAYRLNYSLERVLSDEGGGVYVLDHDFAFPDRPGSIERFSLRLEAEPAWHSERGLPFELERGRLGPSESVVVTLPLEHAEGASSRVSSSERRDAGRPLLVRVGLAAALAGVVLLLVRAAWRRERELGRFAAAPSAPPSAQWLREHVLSLRPELVGALYHEAVGVAEVAALLARLELDGKLENVAGSGREGMMLRLCAERTAFHGYERELIDKLFFAGDETSARALRKHYAAVGFHPPSVLAQPVGHEMSVRLGAAEGDGLGCLLVGAVLSGVAALIVAFLVIAGSMPAVEPSWLVFAVAFGSAAFGLGGASLARRARGAQQDVRAAHEQLALWLAAGTGGVACLLVAARTLPLTGLLTLSGLGLALIGLLLWLGRTRYSREGVALRRQVLLARQCFGQLLARGEREDAWVPYLIALDLRDGLASVARDIPGPAPAPQKTRSESRSSGSITPPAPAQAAWAGAGGRFGGAGASFTWGEAVIDLARGVAAPASRASSSSSSSSSRSSSGSRGGSSSSGGGGGGGW